MKKMVLAIVVSIAMLLGSIPTSFANPSSTATLTVKANKTAAQRGEEVEFSVELTQSGDIAAVEAYVQLPDGLDLVAGSFLPATDKTTLGWDDFTVDENYLMIIGYGSVGYAGSPVVLATFKCTVDANALGQQSVTLYDVYALDAGMNDKYPVSVAADLDVVIPATGISLDRDTLDLDTGSNNTATLVATVEPNIATDKTVLWESTDESVATVNDGVVTAVKHGTTSIIAKTSDGAFSDTCAVTVACAHTSKTFTDAKVANCKEGGWDAYYTCDDCSQLFDSTGQTKIDAIPTTGVDSSNHNYGTLVPTTSEKHTTTELVAAVAAHYQCSICQKYFTEAKVETTMAALTGTIPVHEYGDWVKTDATQHWKECTCGDKIEVGQHVYDHACDTTCNTCGYTRVTNHIPSSTWTKDGGYHWKVCSVEGCGAVIEGSKEIHESTGSNIATCKKLAVCDECSVSYGEFATHIYEVQEIKEEALIIAGNCRDEAVYYYSCSVCSVVEGDENHTFKGEKVATSHVGGTTIVNAVEANHKTQTNGYTGDTKCLGCNQIIGYGQPIPTDAHTPATAWSNDGTHHWKACTVSGCDVVIEGTKAIHYSNKVENKATCQKVAVCDVCGVSYGDVASHDWDSTYSKDATGHWYDCQTSGCGEKKDFATHTPDHQGSATEDYAITCTGCQYEIEAQLAHTHIYDKEVVKEIYKASNATCDNPATYYKSCKCGAFQSNETFNYGEPAGHSMADATCTLPKTCDICDATEGEALGHTEGNDWYKDSVNHWHICTVASCGVVIEASKAEHTPDRVAPTETDPILCTTCGYVIATQQTTHYHVHGKEWKYDHYEHWNECSCSNKAFIARHADTNQDGLCDTCGYGVPVVATATIPTSPKTGHNSMVWIWTTLAGLFGFICVSVNVLRKKK